MSRIKHCEFCGEPQKEVPCETCGADEEKIQREFLEREYGQRFLSPPVDGIEAGGGK